MSNQTEKAIDLLQNITDLMNERMYFTWQMIFMYEDIDKYAKSDIVLQQWNTRRGFNREMLRFYYGDILYNKEREIHYDLRYIGQILECARNNSDYSILKEARDKADVTTKSIIDFNIKKFGLICSLNSNSACGKRAIF